MDPFDNLAQSIHIFNHICEQTQIIDVDLNAQTINDYVDIVNNVAQSLHRAAPAEHSYIMLYTDSLFDALDILRYYLHHIPSANTADFIGNQGFSDGFRNNRHHRFTQAMYRGQARFPETRVDGLVHSPSHVVNTLYINRRLPGQRLSYCDELAGSQAQHDDIKSENSYDMYYGYILNMIEKEFTLVKFTNLMHVSRLLSNKKFFNKLTIIRTDDPNHSILRNTDFCSLTRDAIENINDRARYFNNQNIIDQMAICYNVGLNNINDQRHWGNRINTTVVFREVGQNIEVQNINNWLQYLKQQSNLANLPNDLIDIREIAGIFFNYQQKNNSQWGLYVPIYSTCFGGDIINNSTISYIDKYSHNLFGGAYQTLPFGPIWLPDNNFVYEENLLKTFSVNYRSSTPLNQAYRRLLDQQQNGNFTLHNQMIQDPQHNSWGPGLFAREELIERIYSTIKSVQFARLIAQNAVMPGAQEGVLPLMQRLVVVRGSGSNIFQNGDIAYIPYFWSCSTNYDVAHSYNEGYIYIILLEPGEHCPFINMGNFLKEVTLPPGTLLRRHDTFQLPDLIWNNMRGHRNPTFIMVRPAIGNFTPVMAYLDVVADAFHAHRGYNTCVDFYGQIYNTNNHALVTGTTQLRAQVDNRMPIHGNIRVGGTITKRKTSAKTSAKTSLNYLDFNLDINKIKKHITENLKKNDSYNLIKLDKKMQSPKSSSPKSSSPKSQSPKLTKKQQKLLEDENDHWGSELDATIPSFKNVNEVQEYISMINKGMNNAIKEMKKEMNSSLKGGDKRKRIDSPFSEALQKNKKTKKQFNIKFNNYIIETDKNKVLNKETMAILTAKEFSKKK